MQGKQSIGTTASLKAESVWFKTKLVSQFLAFSFLLSNPFYLSYLHATPVGGNVVGGTGSISQTDLTTTINQSSQNLAIDWQSFDVNTNEKVNFVQPDSSSIALNRILGNNGTTIHGQINANGQVILVNPNGIYFTSTARINVGGLVASSLDISPSDFMNGNYIFNEVLGTDGAVVNSGIINASLGGDSSTGGNVALIGKKVKNEGLISANLGSVVLAAGKQSVLTFDDQGLIGVSVTKEVLQEELGLEQAIINSGEINAAGGRVLLTASVSQDVFSQAVNSGTLNQTTSVVVNADGSFTLGGGADVLNTGSIDVSSESNFNNTARIILLGENITSSGSIKADTNNSNAGEIEIHAKNKTLLIENSITSAQSLSTGQGGLIKILGDKVGLFDQSSVDASGVNGGGDVLIGGDRQGLNSQVRNAEFIYLGEDATVKADATESGDGGKIITFAKDTARIHGGLFARGGSISGNGGFIETSGLIGFEITNAPDVSAFNGDGGLWLIDPNNIRIVNDGAIASRNINTGSSPFRTTNDDAILEVGFIESVLNAGNNVEIETRSNGTDNEQGSISFEANLDFEDATGNNNGVLRLLADRDINFTNGSSINSSNSSTNDSINIELNADINNDGLGNIDFNGTTINTYGGYITILNARNVTSTTNASTITTQGGNFTVNQGWNYNNSTVSFNSGLVSIDLAAGNIDLDGVNGAVTLGSITETGGGNDFDIQNATSISQVANSSIVVADRGRFGNTTSTTSINLISTTNTNDFNSVRLRGASATINDLDGINIADGTNLNTLLDITAGGNITENGTVIVSDGGSAIANFDTTGTVNIVGNNHNFDQVNIKNATSVIFEDNAGGLAFAANDGLNNGGITGNLTLRVRNGNITSYGEVNAGTLAFHQANFTVDNDQSINLNSSNNTFTGRVFFNVPDYSGGDRINNLTFTDDSALALENIEVTGNLIVSGDTLNFKHTHVNSGLGSGTFSATTTNASGLGHITQDGTDITIYGTASTTLDATGNITLNDANNDFKNVTILNGNVVSLRDTNAISLLSSTTTGNLSIQASGDISLVGDITTNTGTTAAGNVTFTGNVLLATPTAGDTITINTNHATLGDGTVTFNNFVDNDVATSSPIPRNNLNIISGDGDVSFLKGVGTDSSFIGALTINDGLSSTAIVNLDAVNTRSFVSDSTNAIDITAGTINLNGDLKTNWGPNHARGINLEGNVVLNGSDIVFLTNGSSSDGAVTVTGTINSDAGNNRRLEIETGSALVDLQGATIGNVANAELKSLRVNAGKSTFGTVRLGAVTTTGGDGGNNVIDVKGTTIELNGNLVSHATGTNDGGNINLEGNLQLNQSVSITSDLSSLGGSNGDVTITGNINSAVLATTRALKINADDNNISIGGNIGTGTNGALQKVELLTDGSTGTQVSVNAITTTDTTAVTNAATAAPDIDSGVILTAATINLDGDITTNIISGSGTEAGVVDINGNVNLISDISINSNLSLSPNDGAIDISGNINSSTNQSLTLDAGNANVSISGDIGSTTNSELSGFTITDAGTTDVVNIATETGGINIRSGTINLAGGLNTTAANDAGAITLTGDINLIASGTSVSFNTVGSGNDANISITGTVNNAVSKDLSLDAGNADVFMTGTAGTAVNPLLSLQVSADNVDLGQVNSSGSIVVDAATSIDLSGNLTTTDLASNIELNKATATDITVTLLDNVTLQVANDSSITVDGTIDSDAAANNHSLTVTSDTGTIDLNGDIGLLEAVQGLSITTNGTVNLASVDSRSGGVVVSSNTLNLSGSIDTTDDATSAGVVTLTQDTLNLLANISIATNSVAGIDKNISILDPFPSTIAGNSNTFSLDAGTGTINIDSEITDLTSFTVSNSQSTTLNGITTNDGLISVNATNGIALSGTYDSGTGNMDFYADSDSNFNGTLTLNAGSQFNGNNIIFSGVGLVANTNLITASNELSFNSTSYIVVGDNSFSTAYKLNNSFLQSVSAGTINISSSGANRYVLFENTDLSAVTSTLNVNADLVYFYRVNSAFDNVAATANVNMYFDTNVNAVNSMSFTAPNLNMRQFTSATPINLTSTTADITLTGNVTNFRDLKLNVLAGTVFLDNTTFTGYTGSLTVNANAISHANLLLTNSIDFTSGSAYTQAGSLESVNGYVSITSAGTVDLGLIKTNAGSISVTSGGNLSLGDLQTNTGSITLLANNGAITDNNSGTNITTSGTVSLTATGGIGSGDALELAMNGPDAKLTAINSGSGNIEITNTGDITLEDITNNAADSAFNFIGLSGDVTITKVTLDRTYDNRNAEASFDIKNGNVYADPNSNLHIAANSISFNMNGRGSIGEKILDRPVIVDVPYKLTDINSISTYIRYYQNRSPFIYEGANEFKNKALQAIENISGQQLIEVESLGEVDEAIFTDVRNYSHSDIALMMPSDQRYTEDEEEDEEAKVKRQNLINSTP